MLPRLVTHNTYIRSFQYKILNSILYLNKKLHIFGIKSSPLCSFCNLYDKTPFHIFYECDRVKCLWSDLVQCFQNTLILLTLTHRLPFLEFLILEAITHFLKTIKYSSITFCLFLSYTSINPEKRIHKYK